MASTSGFLFGDYNMLIGNNLFGWSNGDWNQSGTTILPGLISYINTPNMNSGIPLPIDLFPNDVIKICGNSYIQMETGTTKPDLTVTIVYATCQDFNDSDGSSFSVLPLIIPQSFAYEHNGNTWGTLCFEISYVLNQTFKACDTTLYVGFGWDMKTTDDSVPIANTTFSVTTERDCAYVDTTPNILLKLCCEEIITEVVYNTSLTVGDFFVDDEGNCWEAMTKTGDLVTGLRNVTVNYNSCSACIAANPCPQNLEITSCCGGVDQTFTGSLPGINVGDNFVDTLGFCWSAGGETSTPITGTVTVGTNYGMGGCESCLEINPCPVVYVLRPCCDSFRFELYVTALSLGYTPTNNEVIVDTFGTCWLCEEYVAEQLPFINGAFIHYSATYGISDFACKECTIDHPCGQILYYTVENCCTLQSEVFEWSGPLFGPGQVVSFSITGSYIGDQCWKIFSWNSVGIPTITIDPFSEPIVYGFECISCIKKVGCPIYYEVADCCGVNSNEVMLLLSAPITASFSDTNGNCWYIVGETVGPDTVIWDGNVWGDCVACNNYYFGCTLVGVVDCCMGIGSIISLELLGNGVTLGDTFVDQFGLCWSIKDELPTYGNPTIDYISAIINYDNCETCLLSNPCPILYFTIQNCCTLEEHVFSGDTSLVSFTPSVTYPLITSLDTNSYDCWTVKEFSNTGTTTIDILDVGSESACLHGQSGCDCCINNYGCHYYYLMDNCCVPGPQEVMYLPESIGGNFGISVSDTMFNCWSTSNTVVTGPATVIWDSPLYYPACASCICP